MQGVAKGSAHIVHSLTLHNCVANRTKAPDLILNRRVLGPQVGDALFNPCMIVHAILSLRCRTTTGLDLAAELQLLELVASLRGDGLAVVAVLHDLTMAARYCDRLLLMDRGQLVAQGAPLEVLSEANLRSVYGVRARIEGNDAAPLVVPTGRIPQPESH